MSCCIHASLRGCPELPETCLTSGLPVGKGGRPRDVSAPSPSSPSLWLLVLVSHAQKCRICGRMWRVPGETVCAVDTVALFLFFQVPPCHAVTESPYFVSFVTKPPAGSMSFIPQGNSTLPHTYTDRLPLPIWKITRVK